MENSQSCNNFNGPGWHEYQAATELAQCGIHTSVPATGSHAFNLFKWYLLRNILFEGQIPMHITEAAAFELNYKKWAT